MLNSVKRVYKLLKFFANSFHLKNFKILIPYLIQKYVFKKRIPAAVYISSTYKCNFKCFYCGCNEYAEGRTWKVDKELSNVELKRLIDQLIAMKAPRIHFIGGEPLLRAGIDDLIEYTA